MGITDTELQRVIYVRLDRAWDHISNLREFAHTYVKLRTSEDSASRVSMICEELLENAVKYGEMMAEVEFEILLSSPARNFEVRVTNDAVESRASLLRKELTRLETLSPKEGYLEAMQRTTKLLPGSSMLGLARIRYEGAADIRMETRGRKIALACKGSL